MENKFSRRDFLIKSALFTGAFALSPFDVFSSVQLSLDERVLVGITKPKDLTSGNFLLRKEAGESFQAMIDDAKKEGVEMYSQSSYRSYNRQLAIWERKYRRYQKHGYSERLIVKKILEYSTIPGTSRHHWGTDLDIIDTSKPLPSDPLSKEHFMEGGIYEKLYEWMLKNAQNYGFKLAYTNNEERDGFEFEPWHWSYEPLSKPMLKAYNEIKLNKFVSELKISGKKELSKDFLKKYKTEFILGINPDLLP